jgi:hypothetical protein
MARNRKNKGTKASKKQNNQNKQITTDAALLTKQDLANGRFWLQTVLDPAKYKRRGIANTSQSTALATFRQQINIVIPPGTSSIFLWCPDCLTDKFNFGSGLASVFPPTVALFTSLPDPVMSGGPFFNIDPSETFRVVGARCIFIPTGSLLNQSGSVQIACEATLPEEIPAATYSIADLPNASWAYYTDNALNSFAMHWFPSDENNTFLNSAFSFDSYATSDFITYAGALNNTGTASSGYTVEIEYLIEYTPSVAYRPYVATELPRLPSNSWSELNILLGNNKPKVVGRVMQGVLNTFSTSAGGGGAGGGAALTGQQNAEKKRNSAQVKQLQSLNSKIDKFSLEEEKLSNDIKKLSRNFEDRTVTVNVHGEAGTTHKKKQTIREHQKTMNPKQKKHDIEKHVKQDLMQQARRKGKPIRRDVDVDDIEDVIDEFLGSD